MRHSGMMPEHCPLCKKDLPCSDAKQARAIVRRHNAAVNRRERDQAMRDIGLTKVRGRVSGRTYWE